MSDRLRLPGTRDVRATLDGSEESAVVVACPPHPQLGGSRSDTRLRAVSDALVERGCACLRFDYGQWDEGAGERTDADQALSWAAEHFDAVGLFGYSFGAAVALVAATEAEPAPRAVSVLAPPARLVTSDDVADALTRLECPLQIVYGERDTTVDWEPVVDRARESGRTVVAMPADHHFVGQTDRIGETVATFLVAPLRD